MPDAVIPVRRSRNSSTATTTPWPWNFSFFAARGSRAALTSMAWASTEEKTTVQARSVLTSSPPAQRQAVKPGTARDWSSPGPSSNSTQRAVSAYSQTYGRCSGPMPMTRAASAASAGSSSSAAVTGLPSCPSHEASASSRAISGALRACAASSAAAGSRTAGSRLPSRNTRLRLTSGSWPTAAKPIVLNEPVMSPAAANMPVFHAASTGL